MKFVNETALDTLWRSDWLHNINQPIRAHNEVTFRFEREKYLILVTLVDTNTVGTLAHYITLHII